MFSPVLDRQQREDALTALETQQVDVLVVGGGATGAGVALDAVARGLTVGLLDAQDWSAGTSSRSSKLIHGGLRYLYQFNVPLVAEALHERGLLMTLLAPHLVTAQPFLWPLLTPVVERSYSAVGVGAYDMLAFVGSLGARTMPPQKHYGKAGVAKIAPGLAEEAYRGAIRFFDARVDDSRLVLALVRTAVGYGAHAASRTRVEEYTRSSSGRVTGARVTDVETGREFHIRARHVVNATGVWTQQSEALAGVTSGLRVLASKGIHLVVPKDRIESETGIFLRTEKSVLFIIPWERYWVIGTTDTPYQGDLTDPVARADDVEYVLEHANGVLARKLTKDDIIGTYAGLRPLVQATTAEGEDLRAAKTTTKVSREHVVMEAAPGLLVIAGGKLTTYRVMAEDAVDAVLGEDAKERPSITERLPLVGAQGHAVMLAQADNIAERTGWSREQVDHLISRYGDEIRVLEALALADPSLWAPLERAPEYVRAEVAFAARYEGALHVEDVLRHRVRLDYEHRDRGMAAADEVAEILAPILGWSAEQAAAEIERCRRRTDRIAAAELGVDAVPIGSGDGATPRLLGDPPLDEEDEEASGGSHALQPRPDGGRPSLRVVPD